MQTYRSVYIVHNVAHAGALVLAQLAIVKHLTCRAQSVLWNALGVIRLDDIPQHQHIVRRLALPRVGFGVHTRTDAAYERLELLGLEWRLALDGLDHVLSEKVFDGPLEERWTLRKAGLVALIDLDLDAIELDVGLERKGLVVVDLNRQIARA